MNSISARTKATFIDFDGKFWLYRFSREMGVQRRDRALFYCWQIPGAGRQTFIERAKFEGEPFTAGIWVSGGTQRRYGFPGAHET